MSQKDVSDLPEWARNSGYDTELPPMEKTTPPLATLGLMLRIVWTLFVWAGLLGLLVLGVATLAGWLL